MEPNQLKERVREQFGINAEKYVSSKGHAEGEDLNWMVDWIAPESTWTVLDIATGGGHVAKKLAPMVAHVTATDITPTMLSTARRHLQGSQILNVSYVVSDAEALPFLDDTFDVVTCRIAPHHFPNPDVFVRESARVLHPGGKFLLIDNVSPEDDVLAAYHNQIESVRDESHVRCLSVPEWNRLFGTNELDIIKSQIFRKPFSFRPWAERMAKTADQTMAIEQAVLAGSGDAMKYFDVQVENGHVESLAIDSWIALGVKR